ncbi:MAG: PPOX class F420-dependent oxidoreductase [Acidimicrobiales bacterium]
MQVLNEAARAAIEAGNMATLATVGRDGAPQLSMVWVGLDGDDLVVGHLGAGAKVRNVAADGRVALTMLTGGANPVGLHHYLIIKGTATVEQGGAPELLHRLAQVYVGPGTKFPPMDDPPEGHVIRITPTNVGGVGPWSD